MANTVPKALTPQLLDFCRELSAHRPVFVSSKPSADAVQSFCFDNVGRKTERAGGTVAYGWAIWSLPGVYFEAEHHGVWCNRQGKLIDVSPQLNGARKIVFLPDPRATYNPLSYRSNVLKAVGDNPLSAEFVRLANARSNLLDMYREGGARIVSISIDDNAEQKRLEQRMREIWPMLFS